MDVIAKAEMLEPQFSFSSLTKENACRQKELISKRNISYGGVRLDALLADNTWKGGASPHTYLFTFKAGKLTFAKPGLLLKQSNINKRFPFTSLKWYYSEIKNNERKDYNTVKEIIDNPDNWLVGRETERVSFPSDYMNFLSNRINRQSFDNMLKILKERIGNKS